MFSLSPQGHRDRRVRSPSTLAWSLSGRCLQLRQGPPSPSLWSLPSHSLIFCSSLRPLRSSGAPGSIYLRIKPIPFYHLNTITNHKLSSLVSIRAFLSCSRMCYCGPFFCFFFFQNCPESASPVLPRAQGRAEGSSELLGPRYPDLANP